MTLFLIAAIGLLAGGSPNVVAACAVGSHLAISMPVTIPLAAVVAGGWRQHRRWQQRRVVRDRSRRAVVELAEMTLLGLTGGLGAGPSLSLAAGSIGGPIADEVHRALRMVHVEGWPALISWRGGCAHLFRVIGRGVGSGSSLVEPVTVFVDQAHADAAGERLAAVRRLPVAMLFPLTLLILPGFVLLTVAPALLEAFGRLDL